MTGEFNAHGKTRLDIIAIAFLSILIGCWG